MQLLAGILAAAVASGPALTVDAGADRHAISPDIYGMNFADPALAREIELPVDRWGGNRTETYNWRVGASNSGNDWYFENIADCWDDQGAWCSHGNADRDWIRHVEGDAGIGTKTLLTLPMMGSVAKDAPRRPVAPARHDAADRAALAAARRVLAVPRHPHVPARS